MLSSFFRPSSRHTGKAHRYLIAFGDTEGVESRNGLWSLTLLFLAVATGPPRLNSKARELPKLVQRETCFHMLSLNCTDPSPRSPTTGKAVTSHFEHIQELRKHYDARGIVLCFWNASHDNAQLRSYEQHIQAVPGLQIHCVDMIKFVRALARFPKYNLNFLRYQTYASADEEKMSAKQKHTALADTKDMIYVLYAVLIDYNTEQLEIGAVGENRQARPKHIADSIQRTSLDTQIKAIVKSDIFLIGLLSNPLGSPLSEQKQVQQEQQNKSKPRQSSFNLIESPYTIPQGKKESSGKYEYFKLDDTEYKVRKGFEQSTSLWYKGYGLYYLAGSKYRGILNKGKEKESAGLANRFEREGKKNRNGTTREFTGRI